MLFCKNLEETRWWRCGGTLTTMPDKLTSSEPASAAATATPQATSAARMIYRNAKGEAFEIRGENLLARAFCHEIDHLNGILFLQHLSMLKRDLIKRKIKKLRK